METACWASSGISVAQSFACCQDGTWTSWVSPPVLLASLCSYSFFRLFNFFPMNKWVFQQGQVCLVTAGQWLFLPTCSPICKRSISSMFLGCPSQVCLSPSQWGKAHPHVVLVAFQSMMRAAQSLDILMEWATQSRHGFVFLQVWVSGPYSTCGCSRIGWASKGTCRSQRPSLVLRQGLRLNNLTFTYIHQTNLTPHLHYPYC